jgi:uncharacterized metal-binding protein
MSGERDCCCPSGTSTLVFACSGSSNVGQLTHGVALRLARDGLGVMSCLAGVGAHLSGFVVPAKDCERLVVLDGCEHRCALKTLERVGVAPHVYIHLTEQGFAKQHGVPAAESELERAYVLAARPLKGAECSIGS